MNEIIDMIAAIEAEQRRRAAGDRLARYNKGRRVHKKQLAFHKCKKRNRWVFGGNRSGKTECGAVEAVWMARGVHPYRKNRQNVFGWVVSLSQQVQRDVAQKKLLSYLRPDQIVDIVMLSGRKDSPSSGVIDQIVVRNELGGTGVIGFKSCDQGREKFQGSSLDFVWFDEEPPKDIYEECLMRVFDRQGDIFGTMTPLKGLTFLYDEIYLNKKNNPEVWYEFMEWADNPYLSKKEIALLESTMDETTLQSRRFGRFAAREGLVYPEFDESVHVIPPFEVPGEWQDNISIDPGYKAGEDIDYHARRIHEICDALGWKRDGAGRVRALIDSAAGQRTLASQKSVTELFYERDILADARVDKELFSGISRVKSYLKRGNGRPDLYIFSCCPALIRELKSYFWGSGDRPEKRDDHALDELRYYLMTRPQHAEESAVSDVRREKERLLRALRRKPRFK